MLSKQPSAKNERESVEVQEDIRAQMSKIHHLLTNYQQVDEDGTLNFEFINNMDPLDQLLADSGMEDEQQIEFSINSEPVFKVEKVCRNAFFNVSSVTDLDPATDKVSASASVDADSSMIAEDAEMEQSGLTEEPFELSQDLLKTSFQWAGATPTYSCTQSFVE